MALLISDDPAVSSRGEQVLAKIPVLNAVMRNGISPTKVTGGLAGNVIPAEASVVLNVRTIPGYSIDDVIERLRGWVTDPDISFSVAGHTDEAPGSDPGSDMFRAISGAARELDPEITVVPYMSTGGTDSSHLRRIGINAYGVLPFPMQQSDEERMHGHDERVPVESLHFGTRLIYESIRRVATAGALSQMQDDR